MIIDAHVNITPNGKWGNTNVDASVERLLEEMEKASVTRCVIMAIRSLSTNAFIAECVKKYNNRFIGLGNLDTKNLLGSVQEILDMGLSGVKFHPRFQKESIDLWMEKGVFKILEQHKIPVVICGWLQSSYIPIEELTPFKIDRIAKRYPNLKIVIAHMGGHRFWDAFFVARSNENVYLNCSYFLQFFMGTSLLNDFFQALPLIDQKVLFGSDFPENSIESSLSILRDGISNSVRISNDLFAKNALKVFDRYE